MDLTRTAVNNFATHCSKLKPEITGSALKHLEKTLQHKPRRTVFCNMKSVGYNEYFKSQQTGKVVERKCDVHKADYEGEDTVELGGKAYFVLKTYDIDDDTVELTLTDLRYKEKGA